MYDVIFYSSKSAYTYIYRWVHAICVLFVVKYLKGVDKKVCFLIVSVLLRASGQLIGSLNTWFLFLFAALTIRRPFHALNTLWQTPFSHFFLNIFLKNILGLLNKKRRSGPLDTCTLNILQVVVYHELTLKPLFFVFGQS